MIAAFFHLIGVDIRQWKALTRVFIKRDMRVSSMSSTFNHGRSGRRGFISLLVFYFLTGLVFIPFVLLNEDFFISSTILSTYTMFMIGSLILVEYHAVIISPEDFVVLGYQPVDSRTFYVIKLTNLLFYVMIFSSVLALPGLVAFFFVDGFTFVIGLSAFFSVISGNLTVAFTVTLLYTLILNKISPHRFQNIIAFFQVALALVVYSGFFILPRFMESDVLDFINLSNTPWLVLLPSIWFSSAVAIISGSGTSLNLLLCFLAFFVFAYVAVASVGKLSLQHASDIAGRTGSQGKTRRRRKTSKRIFAFVLGSEERVMAKLIRNQFLNDNKFKMAVLGVLPLTLFYLFLSIQDGPLADPFHNPELDLMRTGLLYLIIFLFPMMLRTFVTQSDSFQASWIFHVTPADIPKLIIAEKNFLMIYFILPFLFVFGLIFSYYFDDFLHVLLHLLVLGILSHLFLQFAFLHSPDLPFSHPNIKGQRTRKMTMLVILVPFFLYLLLPSVFTYVYSEITSYVVFVSMIFVLSFLLERLIRVRVQYYMRKREFFA